MGSRDRRAAAEAREEAEDLRPSVQKRTAHKAKSHWLKTPPSVPHIQFENYRSVGLDESTLRLLPRSGDCVPRYELLDISVEELVGLLS